MSIIMIHFILYLRCRDNLVLVKLFSLRAEPIIIGLTLVGLESRQLRGSKRGERRNTRKHISQG